MTDGTSSPGQLARRRGARRPCDVPPAVLHGLQAGEPSVNHMEQMAMDSGALLSALLPDAADRADELRVSRFLDRMRAGAQVVWDLLGEDLFDAAQEWTSDTARGWAAFAVPCAAGGTTRHVQLAALFADDPHFAVREWAWLGLRPVVVAEPLDVVDLLLPLTADPSPRVRRFCSESTRPRGVWSAHVPLFKEHPYLALPLLDPLAAVPERYVRDSVANWLNDAARSTPGWVVDVCRAWEHRHGSDVAYVCRRARRAM